MDGMKFPNKFVENIYKANKVLGKVESVLSIALLWALIVVCMIFISCRFIFHYSTCSGARSLANRARSVSNITPA